MKEVVLTKGKVALVDDADFERVNAFKWSASLSSSRYAETWYAQRRSGGKTIKMHRFILGLSASDPQVDHRDANGLNNQRENIRLATPGQNVSYGKQRVGASGFRGVDRRNGKWRARIVVNRKAIEVGKYDTAQQAAQARDVQARLLHGEFARLNFPDIA